MSEEILEKWGNLRLTEVEQIEVQIDISMNEVVSRCGRLCLIGLIVVDKLINREAFKAIMLKVWKPRGRVQFKGVGDNLFLIEFQNVHDMERVKKGRPWTFDRNFSCLMEHEVVLHQRILFFYREMMWIQLHNVPFRGMTRAVGEKIGSLVGEVVEVDVDDEGIG